MLAGTDKDQYIAFAIELLTQDLGTESTGIIVFYADVADTLGVGGVGTSGDHGDAVVGGLVDNVYIGISVEHVHSQTVGLHGNGPFHRVDILGQVVLGGAYVLGLYAQHLAAGFKPFIHHKHKVVGRFVGAPEIELVGGIFYAAKGSAGYLIGRSSGGVVSLLFGLGGCVGAANESGQQHGQGQQNTSELFHQCNSFLFGFVLSIAAYAVGSWKMGRAQIFFSLSWPERLRLLRVSKTITTISSA